MSVLTVNGIPFPGKAGSAKEGMQLMGANQRVGSIGLMVQLGTRYVRTLSVQTTPLLPATAAAWENLLRAEWFVWFFNLATSNSYYSTRGTAASDYVNTTLGITGKFGFGLRLGATTGTIKLNVRVSLATYTVQLYRYEGAAWVHYTINSAGQKWVDGVRNDGASTTWLTVGSTFITLANTSGAAVDYDEVVVFPWVAPTTWVPIFAARTASWDNYASLDGDLIHEGSTVRSTFAEVETVAVMRGTTAEGSSGALRVLGVNFLEL